MFQNLLPSNICIYRHIGTDHKEEEEEEERSFPRYFMLIEWQSICRVKKLRTGSKVARWLKSWPLVGEEPCTEGALPIRTRKPCLANQLDDITKVANVPNDKDEEGDVHGPALQHGPLEQGWCALVIRL